MTKISSIRMIFTVTLLYIMLSPDQIWKLGFKFFIRPCKIHYLNQVAAAEILLESGADANDVDKQSTSPLYMAAKNGDVDMLKLLLRYKVR